MISVIVYTMNDEKTIFWCLSSLLKQYPATEFEVLVIDDASSDRTTDIVTRDFPQFTLIKQNNAKGWIVSLRDNLLEMNGDIVAILGAHCRATENWVSTIQSLFNIGGVDAVTGSAYHDETNFWDRFHSIVMPTYFSPGPIADFLWEDNFAIRFQPLFYTSQNRFLVIEQHKAHAEKNKIKRAFFLGFIGFDGLMAYGNVVCQTVIMDKPVTVV